MSADSALPLPKTDSIRAVAMARPRYGFSLPKAVRLFPTDPESFTLQPISMQEEQDAIRVSEASKLPLSYELVKASLVTVDGKSLAWDDGSRDRFMSAVSPPVRQLLMAAWDKIHNPPKEATQDFLSSMTVEA